MSPYPETRFTRRDGGEHPIVQAGIAFVGTPPDLAIAAAEWGQWGADAGRGAARLHPRPGVGSPHRRRLDRHPLRGEQGGLRPSTPQGAPDRGRATRLTSIYDPDMPDFNPMRGLDVGLAQD